ncbi:hypothetical protein AKJ09_00519 [Labilithrix luteola]|uniref:Uncharacterized protein n=1 Tax=Labilithrix luteola TaxID=1391654 RepID=A0A0K1PK01_9BACT|nr:hypothetical protein AKJ09_00519 [Labilithrix luteola]
MALSPQHFTAPSFDTAHDVPDWTSTCTTSVRPSTVPGFGPASAENPPSSWPRPSWPRELFPQHRTVPSEMRAQ